MYSVSVFILKTFAGWQLSKTHQIRTGLGYTKVNFDNGLVQINSQAVL